MGSNVFGVDPESGVPPDTAPAPAPDPTPGSSEAERRPHMPEDAGSTPAPATTEEPPAAPAPPPAEPPKPAGPPIDDEEAAYLAGENEDGFVLGQRKYKSLAAADHVFRRFGGRAHAAEERAKAAEERASLLEGRLTETLTGRPQDAPPGAPADAPAPTPSAPQRLTDLVKPEEFDELIAEHGPGAAYAKVAELVENRMGQALDERMAPLQPLMNRTQGVELATSVFDSESGRTREDGSRLYPELDPDTPESDAVVGVWTEMLGDPDFSEIAFTRHGVRQAVLEYRARAGNGQPAPPPDPAINAERSAAIQDMGHGSRTRVNPTPGAPGPTRMLPADLEEGARKAVAASQHPIFGTTMERRQ